VMFEMGRIADSLRTMSTQHDSHMIRMINLELLQSVRAFAGHTLPTNLQLREDNKYNGLSAQLLSHPMLANTYNNYNTTTIPYVVSQMQTRPVTGPSNVGNVTSALESNNTGLTAAKLMEHQRLLQMQEQEKKHEEEMVRLQHLQKQQQEVFELYNIHNSNKNAGDNTQLIPTTLTQLPNQQKKFMPENALATAGLLLRQDMNAENENKTANEQKDDPNKKKNKKHKKKKKKKNKPEKEKTKEQIEAKAKKIEMFLRHGIFDFAESDLSSGADDSSSGSDTSGGEHSSGTGSTSTSSPKEAKNDDGDNDNDGKLIEEKRFYDTLQIPNEDIGNVGIVTDKEDSLPPVPMQPRNEGILDTKRNSLAKIDEINPQSKKKQKKQE